MAEASIEWKVETLREIIAAPLHSSFAPKPGTDEMAWFIDMEKDGFVEGTWGRKVDLAEVQASLANAAQAGRAHLPMLPTGGREVCSSLHVTEKGKKFVRDYDANRQAAEELKRFDVQELLKWDSKKLAEWQSQYKADQAQWVLADHEWKRRAGVSTRRIAIAAITISAFSFFIAALGYFYPKNMSSSPTETKSPLPASSSAIAPTLPALASHLPTATNGPAATNVPAQ